MPKKYFRKHLSKSQGLNWVTFRTPRIHYSLGMKPPWQLEQTWRPRTRETQACMQQIILHIIKKTMEPVIIKTLMRSHLNRKYTRQYISKFISESSFSHMAFLGHNNKSAHKQILDKYSVWHSHGLPYCCVDTTSLQRTTWISPVEFILMRTNPYSCVH